VEKTKGLRKEESPSSGGEESPDTKFRSWNKRLIYDMQEVGRDLNNERKARRELEEWKATHEPKLEEMKKKVRAESDARLKLEEEYKKNCN